MRSVDTISGKGPGRPRFSRPPKGEEILFRDEPAAEAFDLFIRGAISSHTAGEMAGTSHQQIINRTAKYFREGYQSGKMKIEGKL